MKIINDNKLLKVRSVENLENVEIEEYEKDVWIAKIDDEYYMIVKRGFKNNYKKDVDSVIKLENAVCEIQKIDTEPENLKLDIKYGDEDAIIVDMQGIDNFISAKSLVFKDETVRKIMLKLNLINENEKYLRIGGSGARECDFHPGGEVYECSVINGKDGSGFSQNVSGYLPKGEGYSKSISLYDENKDFLREERIVYSHTAFLRECGIEKTKSIYIKIKPTQDKVSLLDVLNEVAQKMELHSYAIQICIQNNNAEKNSTTINGRVLRHMPLVAFKVLQEATDIGLEKLFELENGETMYAVGTKYDRYEPEWKDFTGGRQYERRGHIHARVEGNKSNPNSKHEVFHLRDAFISTSTDIQVVLTPVDTIYRIYPLYRDREEFYCKSSNKNIKQVILNIKKEDKGTGNIDKKQTLC